MLETLNWSAFFSADGLERARIAREVATEVEYLARVAYLPALRQGYLNLQRELTYIADQIEEGMERTDACEGNNAA